VSSLVGREAELGAVETFLRAERPCALAIVGEPGIGKTTLWQAAVEHARAQGARVLIARPTPIHWRKTGSMLHGSITLSRPQGTYNISGSVNNGKIKFGAVSVGAKYKGKVRGTSMSGTWTSPRGGGTWSATKSS